MPTTPNLSPSARAYRVDRYRVAASARTEFLHQIKEIHEFLRTQPGFIDEYGLERKDRSDGFNFIAATIWESATAARQAAKARHAAMGFGPQIVLARLQIEADLANYEAVDLDPAADTVLTADPADIFSPS